MRLKTINPRPDAPTKHRPRMVDAIERKRRKWHGQQTKKGIKKAKVHKQAVKKAEQRLRKTSKEAIVKSLFKVKNVTN